MDSTLLRPAVSSTSPSTLIASTTSRENDDDRHMLPCRFFAHGYCHKGIRCRFYHPTPVHLRSSIRVPPLPAGFQQQGGRRVVVVEPVRRSEGRRIFVPFARDAQLIHRQLSSTHRPSRGPFSNLTNQYGSSRRSRSSSSAARQQFRMIPYNSGVYAADAALKYAADGWEDDFYQQLNSTGRVPLFVPPPPQNQQKDLQYNTIFKHIRWSDFLAPGQLPPAPTCVPIEKDGEKTVYSAAYNAATRRVAEASKAGKREDEDEQQQPGPDGDAGSSKKLSAKEELHVKVREIANELANEPKPERNPIVMDSYFLKYKLSGERAALLIGPKDISRVARVNRITVFGEKEKRKGLSAPPIEESPRKAVVEATAEEIAKRLTISSSSEPSDEKN